MAKLQLVAGTTSKDINIFVNDSSVATGAGLTGLVYNSGSLTAYYHRQGANAAVAITLATKTLGTWASGGFVAVDGTNMPGLYELGIPDAALAAGAAWVIIMLKGATNMAPVVLEIELTAINNQDAVRGGMTALPNAAAAATGGLPTVDASNAVKVQSGTGANQISLSSGLVTLAGVTHTGAVIPTVTTATNVTTVNGLASGVITAASLASDAITAAKIATDAIDADALAASAITEIQSGLATPTNITAGTITTVTNLTNAPTAGDFTATMKTSITTAATAATPSVTVSDKTGFSLSSAGVQAIWDKLTSALTTVGSIGKLLVDYVDAPISSAAAPPSAATIADAVWDEARSGHTAAGSFGQGVASVQGDVTGSVYSVTDDVGGNVVGSIGSLATQAKADVNAEADTALADVGVTTTVTGRIDDTVSSRLASASITLSGGAVTVGTNDDKTGYALSSAGIQAIWDALTSALTTAGSIGKLLVDNVNATISSVYSRLGAPVGASLSADIAAIQADTDNIQTRLPASLVSGKMDSTAAISGQSVTDITNGVLSGIGSLDNVVAADVWTYTAGGGRTLTNVTPGASLVATIAGSTLTLIRAVSFDVTLTGLSIPSNWAKLYFTVKTNASSPDNQSLIQIVVSNPSGSDGLLYLQGGTSPSLSYGSLVVDQPGGNVAISITDDATVTVQPSQYSYDLKVITSASKSAVLASGLFNVTATPTLTV